jgi:Tol biopolymer transport system component
MGEVYKAKDTRLDRTVAVKVLPAALAADAEFRERFEREAKSISALNHANICTLHDVGRERPRPARGASPRDAEREASGGGVPTSAEKDEVDFLVMEFLDGETLAARLAQGALPLAEALKIAAEIAGALDKAHRQGIVHRDLKPGNVMLTKAGSKLLDFGLAKTGSAAASGAYATVLPTAAAPLTAQGTLLGTFQYMAPEQIEGEQADARSDIFAFGVVLYEMLTGRKAFSGKTQASLFGAILKDEPPPVSQVQPVVPPALDYVIRTCLAKDPDARFQTAHDLLLQLKWITEGGSGAGLPAPVTAHRRRRERLAWMAAAGLGAAFLVTAAIAVIHFREAAPVVDPVQFTMTTPENTLFAGQTPQFAVSPDGRQVVFVATERTPMLWVRQLSTLVARPLPGTEQATYPFWSPDSRFIGFFAGGKLKKVPAGGGPPVALCDAPGGRGGTWNRENVILFTPTPNSPLLRVASAGGTATPVTALDKNATSHRWPQFLPDGRHFLFLSGTPGTASEIRVGTFDQTDTTAVAASDTNAMYAAGHLLLVRSGSLMAHPFDPDRLHVTGDPYPVAEQVGVDAAVHAAYSASDTGVLAYARGSTRPTARLTWFDRAGKVLGTAGDPGEYSNIAISPDERRVAASLATGTPANRDIWLIDLARAGTPSRFTFDPAQDGIPIWSPEGAQVAFVSNRGGAYNIYIKVASGGGQEELVAKSDVTDFVTDWSRDGKTLAYSKQTGTTGSDLWVLPMTGDKKPVLFLQTPYNEDDPQFSPDGRWVAYTSNESNTPEVYVRPFPAAPGQYQVSRKGGSQPQWRFDGKELFFLAPDGMLMSATVATTKGFEADVAKPLFPTGVVFTGNRHQFAVSKDGTRFLVIVPEQRTSPAPITVVLNWPAAVQK